MSRRTGHGAVEQATRIAVQTREAAPRRAEDAVELTVNDPHKVHRLRIRRSSNGVPGIFGGVAEPVVAARASRAERPRRAVWKRRRRTRHGARSTIRQRLVT